MSYRNKQKNVTHFILFAIVSRTIEFRVTSLTKMNTFLQSTNRQKDERI